MAFETINLTGMETSDLLALSRLIEQEYSRRRVLEEAPAQAEGLAKSYLEASGDLLTYKGKTYRIVQAHTSAAHWTPDAVASLYTVVG